MFGETDIARSVNENSPPGTNVGKPVTAGDAGDVLTYTLGADDETDMDNALYIIDPATGQIMVGPRTTLNAEATSGPGATDRDTRRLLRASNTKSPSSPGTPTLWGRLRLTP